MKKLLALICLLSLIFCLAGCKKENKENKATISSEFETNSKVVLGEKFTDFDGVDYSITKVVFDGEKSKIYTELVNNTEYIVTYNPNYHIERFENGKWISCKENNAEDNEVGAHTVPAGQIIRYIHFFHEGHDFSKEGKYRIVTDCDVYKNGIEAEGQKCNVFAVLTLSK